MRTLPRRQRRALRQTVALATALTSTALTACGGGDGDGVGPRPGTPSLSVAVANAAMGLTQGETKTSTVTLTRGGNYTGAVNLAVTGAPAGVTVTFTPTGPNATTSTMTVAVAANATPGTFPLVVRGTGAGVSEATAPVTLTVTAATTPTLAVAPRSLGTGAVLAGSNWTLQMDVTRGGGYAGAVELSAAVVGETPGVSAQLAPATIAAGTGAGASALTIQAAATAARGATTIRVTATGTGVAPATVDVPVTVLVPAVAVTAPGAVSIARGGAATAEIAFSRTDFLGEVTIALENPPAGVTATTVTVPDGQSAGVLNLNVAADAALGAAPLTVRVSGPAGSPSATATLPLTVTQAASYTLAVAPSPVAVTAGGAAAAGTLTINRTNFAGGVTLAASGAPAGLTVTLPSAAVTTNTAVVNVQAGAGLAAGDYPVTITGTAAGLANVTANLLVRVAGAGGGNGGNGGGSTVRFTFCESDAPIWVAAQNGDGPWTRLTEVGPRQYEVTIGQRGALASVTREGAGYDLGVQYLSAAELTGIAQAGCVEPGAGSKTVNGSVAGIATDGSATFSLGRGIGGASEDGPFMLLGVNPGSHTLVAARKTAADAVDRLILRRGVDAPANSTLPLLDFGAAEAFAPTAATLTVENLGADAASVVSMLYTGEVGGGLLANAQGAAGVATLPIVGIPEARLQAGEYNTLMVMAGAAGGTGPQRLSVNYLRGVSNAVLSLGAALAQPAVGTAGTAPYLRPRLQMALQGDYNAFANASFTQGSLGSAVYRGATVSRSAGYSGAPAAWDLAVPDFTGVAGWDANWGLRADATYRWDASAYGGSIATLVGGAPGLNTSFRYATRSGTGGIAGGLRASAAPAPRTAAARVQAALTLLDRAAVTVGRR